MSASMILVSRKAGALCLASAQRAVPLPDRMVPDFSLELLEPRRLLSNGFGDHGWTHASFPGAQSSSWLTTLVAAPNGQFYAGGEIVIDDAPPGMNDFNFHSEMGIARFNADGSLDTSFGSGGMVEVPTSSDTVVDHILLQPDGKVLILGEATNGLVIVRLNADGSVDTGFGGGPQLLTNFNGFADGSAEYDEAMWLNNSGGVTLTAMNGPNLITMHLTANGKPDTAFAPNGYVSAALDPAGDPEQSDNLLGAQPTSDGGAFGYADIWSADSTVQLVAVRVDSAGNIVSQTPVPLGLATVSNGSTGYVPDYYLYMNADGSAFVSSAGADSRIAKLTPNGVLDTSFGSHGYVTMPGSYAAVIGLTPDGGALISSGPFETYDVGSSDTVERITSDGSIDATFNGGQPAGPGAYPGLGLPNGATLLGFPDATSSNETFVLEEIPGNGQEDLNTSDVNALQGILIAKSWGTDDQGNLFTLPDGSTIWNPDGSSSVYSDDISAQ